MAKTQKPQSKTVTVKLKDKGVRWSAFEQPATVHMKGGQVYEVVHTAEIQNAINQGILSLTDEKPTAGAAKKPAPTAAPTGKDQAKSQDQGKNQDQAKDQGKEAPRAKSDEKAAGSGSGK